MLQQTVKSLSPDFTERAIQKGENPEAAVFFDREAFALLIVFYSSASSHLNFAFVSYAKRFARTKRFFARRAWFECFIACQSEHLYTGDSLARDWETLEEMKLGTERSSLCTELQTRLMGRLWFVYYNAQREHRSVLDFRRFEHWIKCCSLIERVISWHLFLVWSSLIDR